MISRRRLLQAAVGTISVSVIGIYISFDDTEIIDEFQSLKLQFLSPEQATILALLMVGILDHEKFTEFQDLLIWLDRIDQALAYLPDNQQQDLLMLLDTLTNKLGRLILTADITKWQQGDSELINKVLAKWRTSSLDILNTAYVGIKQLIMAVWYGEPENWAAIDYPGPPDIGRTTS